MNCLLTVTFENWIFVSVATSCFHTKIVSTSKNRMHAKRVAREANNFLEEINFLHPDLKLLIGLPHSGRTLRASTRKPDGLMNIVVVGGLMWNNFEMPLASAPSTNDLNNLENDKQTKTNLCHNDRNLLCNDYKHPVVSHYKTIVLYHFHVNELWNKI